MCLTSQNKNYVFFFSLSEKIEIIQKKIHNMSRKRKFDEQPSLSKPEGLPCKKKKTVNQKPFPKAAVPITGIR